MELVVKRTVIITNDGHNEWNDSIGERVRGLTKKAYGWTKYGGKNLGLVQEPKSAEWYCQACTQKQGSELPSYMFEFSENEFIRICTLCQAKKLMHQIKTLSALLELVRKRFQPWQ